MALRGIREFGQSIFAALLLAVAALALSCGGSSKDAVSDNTPAVLPTSAPSNTVWLCKPGLADNPCESDLTTTVIAADGTKTTQTASVNQDAPIDCFYVYPTVSGQKTMNADLTIEPAEKNVAIIQASRFSQVCKVYAPMYRQLTLAAINAPGTEQRPAGDALEARDIAYADVLSAWQDYLAHYNNGRGVVLIGHSQGTMMLTRLVTEQIDPNPDVRKLLVSALLLGGNVVVAKGQDSGGDFQNIPACRSDTQTGCVVAYSSFLEQPPGNTIFGRTDSGTLASRDLSSMEVLCTNPASLSGGTGDLLYYNLGSGDTAPWIAYPGEYTGHCENAGGASWLQVDPTNVAGDTRPVVSHVLGPTWGLHLVDVNIALGNLVELVGKEATAYRP
jgi:pimeloyl-ACP methyl ester carboxylesterase